MAWSHTTGIGKAGQDFAGITLRSGEVAFAGAGQCLRVRNYTAKAGIDFDEKKERGDLFGGWDGGGNNKFSLPK